MNHRQSYGALAVALAVSFSSIATMAACTTALVIIDIQNSFVDEQIGNYTWNRTAADRDIVDATVDLLALARDAGIHVIYVQHLGSPLNTTADNPDAMFPEAMAPMEDEMVFTKYLPSSFSAFGFTQYLEDHGIERLILCGIASECVQETMIAGAIAGYEVVIVADAHATEANTPEDAQRINELWGLSKTVLPMVEIPWLDYGCAE